MPLTKLRMLRLTAGKTLYDTAKAAEMPAARLSYLERSIELPREDEKNRIARALGVRPEEIWSDK